ncbi:MAG: hypothetical protein NXI10_07000 [bacterium]|nr:hypothetical protein [bacterium]
MNWLAYLTLAGLSSIKFMFAPAFGLVWKLSFLETYLSCVTGAIITAVIFYYGANYFMRRNHQKKVEKYRKSIAEGTTYKRKKNFTRINKAVVRVKRSIGIFGISMWAPFFLSVPIGSIVTAKFFGKRKITFFIIVCGIFVNGFVSTLITYLFA